MDDEQLRWELESLRKSVVAAESKIMEQRIAFAKRIGSLEQSARDYRFFFWIFAGTVGILVLERYYGREAVQEWLQPVFWVWIGGALLIAIYRSIRDSWRDKLSREASDD